MKKIPSKEKIINQAFKFHSQGNISEASKYYQYFIDQGFSDHRVFANYGVILKGLGRIKDAELLYRKAIELNPDFAPAYSNLGNLLKELGKLKDAELQYRKAIQLNPDYANAHFNLGNVLKELGKLKDAELQYRKVIKLNPDLVNAYCNLGILLQELGKLKDAELLYRKAIQLNPDFAIAHSNLGNLLKELGKLKDAELQYRKAIELNPDFAIAHSNLGIVLRDLGIIFRDLEKLKDAEKSIRKAIKLNTNDADAHFNLGNVLRDLGKLKDAEIFIRKAIELNPNLAPAYFSLSTLKISNQNQVWRDKLFSRNLLDNKSIEDKVDIYFARANICHSESNFKESSKYLVLANNLKQNLRPSNFEYLLTQSKELMLESNKKFVDENEKKPFPENIFIVGMPRSGSTLLESIISMNNNVDDLGEKNILEESFLNWKHTAQKLTLAELYLSQINLYRTGLRTTTNKWLYNYIYVGIICSLIPNAKIIHTYRNPLDNILSIYRANFTKGNEYSSCLVDCAKVYLDQDEVMTRYKKRFSSKIYDLNYDLLVNNPIEEINSLISWLDWTWEDKYLSPHLNPRLVSTASAVQVRSPINSKSVGSWKNYKEMLKPSMKIITQNNKYQDLIY